MQLSYERPDDVVPTGNQSPLVWKESASFWIIVVITGVLLVLVFYEGLAEMVRKWSASEEYGYAYIIPAIVLFFFWQKKDQLERIRYDGSWWGVLLAVIGLVLLILGYLSTLYIIIQYSFVIVLLSIALAVMGWRGFKIVWIPLFFLFFMIPLPVFLYQNLSANLQLISSETGVSILRLFGVSVFLDGNVIDLGNYKLQVVEACSGLRYLFPLASLSFIAAYIYKASLWKRAIVFLSSIPITIFMNSLRIAIIGVLVDKWGKSQAEGFLHYFEGWVIFMACMVILFFEIWALSRIGGDRRSLSEAFSLDLPAPTPPDARIHIRNISSTSILSASLLVAALIMLNVVEQRQEILPERLSFSEFPLQIGDWNGTTGSLERITLDALKLDDYFMSNYTNSANKSVNFYVAYYLSQRKGESAHSPRSCLPGSGWQIKEHSVRQLDGIIAGGVPLKVNRVLIKKGENTELVYYWFQGRSRIITNEYMVKWFLFWDSLTRNRTDGSLIRLTVFIQPGMQLEDGDRILTEFTREVVKQLDDYIPL